jgi:ABC-type thiamine transport system substrate-binding protein
MSHTHFTEHFDVHDQKFNTKAQRALEKLKFFDPVTQRVKLPSTCNNPKHKQATEPKNGSKVEQNTEAWRGKPDR